MKRWLAQVFLAVLSVAAAFEAQAGLYSVATWSYVPSPGGGRIALAGSSSDSCIPTRVDVASSGSTIVLTLVPPPDAACFSAFRPWDFGVDLPFLVGGTYAVAVRTPHQTGDLAQFNVVIPAGGAPASQSIPAGGPLLWGVLGTLLLLVGAARTREGAATR